MNFEQSIDFVGRYAVVSKVRLLRPRRECYTSCSVPSACNNNFEVHVHACTFTPCRIVRISSFALFLTGLDGLGRNVIPYFRGLERTTL